jgi:predicted ATPase/DNA-binding winged helix-turn-helix (wHTH) protein
MTPPSAVLCEKKTQPTVAKQFDFRSRIHDEFLLVPGPLGSACGLDNPMDVASGQESTFSSQETEGEFAFDQPTYQFANFIVRVPQRLLEFKGQPVRISSRAFDILLALLERPGEVIPHESLIARAWPGLNVEQVNLRKQVSALRSLIGQSPHLRTCIINVPGRGYALTVPVQSHNVGGQVGPLIPVSPLLRTAANELVGRDRDLAILSNLVLAPGITCIVGPGGIGKTAVALRLEHVARARFCHTYFVDLAGAKPSQNLVALFCRAIQRPASHDGSLSPVDLAAGNSFIVLDTCEKVVEGAAALAGWLRSIAPDCSVLLTSRAATRAPDERVYVLPPPNGPSDPASHDSSDCRAQVELFISSARAGGYRPETTGKDLDLIASICERLDGNPLAIEIVGSRVATHGIYGTSTLANNPDWLMTQAKRGSPARHRTIATMLEWSLSLLTPLDYSFLCQHSELDGCFSAFPTKMRGAHHEASEAEAQLALSRLLEHSLINTSEAAGSTAYRVPNLVRMFLRWGESHFRRLPACGSASGPYG